MEAVPLFEADEIVRDFTSGQMHVEGNETAAFLVHSITHHKVRLLPDQINFNDLKAAVVAFWELQKV